MRNLILLAFAMFAIAGCTKTNTVVCTVQDTVVSLTSNAVSNKLVCSHPEAVKADILALVEKANLCKPADGNVKGPIGKIICGPLVDSIIGLGKSKIPDAWGCTAGSVPDDLKALILPLCENNI